MKNIWAKRLLSFGLMTVMSMLTLFFSFFAFGYYAELIVNHFAYCCIPLAYLCFFLSGYLIIFNRVNANINTKMVPTGQLCAYFAVYFCTCIACFVNSTSGVMVFIVLGSLILFVVSIIGFILNLAREKKAKPKDPFILPDTWTNKIAFTFSQCSIWWLLLNIINILVFAIKYWWLIFVAIAFFGLIFFISVLHSSSFKKSYVSYLKYGDFKSLLNTCNKIINDECVNHKTKATAVIAVICFQLFYDLPSFEESLEKYKNEGYVDDKMYYQLKTDEYFFLKQYQEIQKVLEEHPDYFEENLKNSINQRLKMLIEEKVDEDYVINLEERKEGFDFIYLARLGERIEYHFYRKEYDLVKKYAEELEKEKYPLVTLVAYSKLFVEEIERMKK